MLQESALVSFEICVKLVVDGINYPAKSKTCKDANYISPGDVITSRIIDIQ